ncbi:cyclin-P3-1-like [Diospyros lotus]|uniref:cyclin-P3-1-like n=1 Tax=Diospyros lotus TaxID=55363 RepID=UPI0022522B69|nr:cyclin-P3-1-like [Diospyros lotus]
MGTKPISGSKSYLNLGLIENRNGGPETPRVITLVSSVIERTIQQNERSLKGSARKGLNTIFHGSRAPALSIRQYLERIYKYSNCSPSCFVVAYIYLDRFLHQMRDVHLTSLNAHRLLITSVMVAAKFMGEGCYNNAYFAKVGGVSTGEMNKLEMNFLFTTDFRLLVTRETFDRYCLRLEVEEAKVERWVELPIQLCGLAQGRTNREERNRASSIAGYTCRAL